MFYEQLEGLLIHLVSNIFTQAGLLFAFASYYWSRAIKTEPKSWQEVEKIIKDDFYGFVRIEKELRDSPSVGMITSNRLLNTAVTDGRDHNKRVWDFNITIQRSRWIFFLSDSLPIVFMILIALLVFALIFVSQIDAKKIPIDEIEETSKNIISFTEKINNSIKYIIEDEMKNNPENNFLRKKVIKNNIKKIKRNLNKLEENLVNLKKINIISSAIFISGLLIFISNFCRFWSYKKGEFAGQLAIDSKEKLDKLENEIKKKSINEKEMIILH